jgi:hypothetical protein
MEGVAPCEGAPSVGLSLSAVPVLQEEQVRRRKREERLKEVCQDGRLRFAAKRTVSIWKAD